MAPDGRYSFQVDSDSVTADSFTAAGVMIDSAAQFNATDLGISTLSIGASVVVTSNPSADSITGTSAICQMERL